MLKNCFYAVIFLTALSLTVASGGQALPTATGGGHLQAGLGWTYAEPDYGQKAIQGVTFFGDYDFLPHIGAEAEFHYISLETPTDLGENSFLVGPRFVWPLKHVDLYAKAMFGIGDIVIQETQDNPQGGGGKYFAYGIGGGLDYKLPHHFVARGDFEYQHWSYFTGLTPTVFTGGIAYRFR